MSHFLLAVLEYFGVHISQLSVLGAARVSHFEYMCRICGGVPTVPLFWRFYYTGKGAGGWLTFEKRRDKKDHPVPSCYEEPFDSLKSWREKFFWVNASVAPIVMRWFDGGKLVRDSAPPADSYNGVLETRLHTHLTKIRRMP